MSRAVFVRLLYFSTNQNVLYQTVEKTIMMMVLMKERKKSGDLYCTSVS